MSKLQKSESRSRSRSASKSRSHSDSRSRSRSQSRSRSRTRKRRYGSRSRSRSRSHSPLHNRERNHTREYQNQREFRGNHRGFRRPYYFRGRGQGFFRGRFQRGVRGGYNNYHPKNWHNFRQNNYQHQQQQQLYYSDSPSRGRPRSRSPKKLSKSTKSRSQSRRSDGSSSGRSPQSHHSSSSNAGSAKRSCKDVREDVSATEGTQGGERILAEPVVGSSTAKDDIDEDETLENGQDFTNHNPSPKRTSLQLCSTVTKVQRIDSETKETSSVQKESNSPNKGADTVKNFERPPSKSSPIKKTTPSVFNTFGLYNNIDQETDDADDISSAFLKFLEDQKIKKKVSAKENITAKGKSNGDAACDKENNKREERSNSSKSGEVKKVGTTNKDQPNSPSFCEDDNKKDFSEQLVDRHTKSCKSKVTLSAREMFEKQVMRMQNMAWDEGVEASNIFAALAKRDQLTSVINDHSPERYSTRKRKDKLKSSSSIKSRLLPRRSSENHEQEMFVVMNEESPPRGSGEFSVSNDCDDQARTSVFNSERRNVLDFVNVDEKDWEFQSLLWQLQAQQLPRSPSELFSQHIVSIVHHIKAQYFPPSELTLNDRFGMYQRRAAEKEIMKARKSPEIHRRIDVSPSAFKRHSLLLDEMKSSMENSFKVGAKKLKGDSMDLRLAIEHRKKYLSEEREPGEEEYGARLMRDSPDSSREIHTGNSSTNHRRAKKSIRKSELCHSSSSSSSSSSEEENEVKQESFSQIQQRVRKYGESIERGRARGGFLRIRGRSWNRGRFIGSNGHSQMNMTSKNEDWDQEYFSKSKKQMLNETDAERKQADASGHGRGNFIQTKGRFILRRATTTSSTNNTNATWFRGKFQATDDEAEQQRVDAEQDQ